MARTFITNSSVVGVDLNNQSSTALFAVGTHVLGNTGTEFVYVQANTSISAFRMCAVNTVSYTAGMASGADVLSGSQLGLAQTSISSQAFGWVAIRGMGLTAWCNSSATAPTTIGVFLATQSASTGAITVHGSGSGTLAGIQIVDGAATTTSTGSLVTVNLSWPRTFTQFG